MAYNIDYKKRTIIYKKEAQTLKELRKVTGIPPETHYTREKS